MTYWKEQAQSFPCGTCGARRNQPCITKSGRPASQPHAIRGWLADRCPRCHTKLRADALPGDVCDRCLHVRELELERTRKHIRRQ